MIEQINKKFGLVLLIVFISLIVYFSYKQPSKNIGKTTLASALMSPITTIVSTINSIATTLSPTTTSTTTTTTTPFTTTTTTTTTPENKAKYIVLEKPTDCQNLSQLYAYEKGNSVVNIALNAQVEMSSLFNNDFPGSNLTSGNENNFAHTACVGDPSKITVILSKPYDIEKIELVNRYGCCQQRVNGTVLKLLNVNKDTIYTSLPLTDPQGNTTFNESKDPTEFYQKYIFKPLENNKWTGIKP